MRTRWEAEKQFALFMICGIQLVPEVYKICGVDLPNSFLFFIIQKLCGLRVPGAPDRAQNV